VAPSAVALLLLMVAGLMTVGSTHAAASRLPNILLILADDLGYGDVGCYNDQAKAPTEVDPDRWTSFGWN